MTTPTLNCNLADGNAHSPTYNSPPVPVLSVFGDGPLCECHSKGSWDFDRAIAEKPAALLLRVRKLGNAKALGKWDDVIFQFGERAFLYGDASQIIGYATTPVEAEQLVREFTAAYGTKKPPGGGSFQLIRKERYDEITCENVDLGPETLLADDVCLHVICTINCTAADIDQALLRPGRLVSHRVFKRQDVAQATALATSLGKTLAQAQDYSLAEVFAEEQSAAPSRPRMGFSA